MPGQGSKDFRGGGQSDLNVADLANRISAKQIGSNGTGVLVVSEDFEDGKYINRWDPATVNATITDAPATPHSYQGAGSLLISTSGAINAIGTLDRVVCQNGTNIGKFGLELFIRMTADTDWELQFFIAQGNAKPDGLIIYNQAWVKITPNVDGVHADINISSLDVWTLAGQFPVLYSDNWYRFKITADPDTYPAPAGGIGQYGKLRLNALELDLSQYPMSMDAVNLPDYRTGTPYTVKIGMGLKATAAAIKGCYFDNVVATFNEP